MVFIHNKIILYSVWTAPSQNYGTAYIIIQSTYRNGINVRSECDWTRKLQYNYKRITWLILLLILKMDKTVFRFTLSMAMLLTWELIRYPGWTATTVTVMVCSPGSVTESDTWPTTTVSWSAAWLHGNKWIAYCHNFKRWCPDVYPETHSAVVTIHWLL